MNYLYILFYFVLGAVTGAVILVAVLYKYLVSKSADENPRPRSNVDISGSNSNSRKEQVSTVIEALNQYLVNKSSGNEKQDNDFASYANMSPTELEKHYVDILKIFKEKQKQLKLLQSFFSDLSKCFATFGNSISKLAISARHNATASVESQDISYVEMWWNSMFIYLDHVGHEHDAWHANIANNLSVEVSKLLDDSVGMEKKLTDEANKFILQMKDGYANFDSKVKEKNKYAERLDKVGVASSEYNRLKGKLASADAALRESTNSLNVLNSHYLAAMPRIIISLEHFCRKSRSILSDEFINHAKYSVDVLKRLLVFAQQLGAELLVVTVPKADKDPIFGEIISGHAHAGSYLEMFNIRDVSFSESVNSEKQTKRFDLSSLGISTLAASQACIQVVDNKTCAYSKDADAVSSAPQVPTLKDSQVYATELSPDELQSLIGNETCVWFNAFLGRIYRDVSVSEYFQKWLCNLISRLLNKAARPDYIEEFRIEKVELGSSPPVLMNMRWIPTTLSKDFESCSEKMGFNIERDEFGNVTLKNPHVTVDPTQIPPQPEKNSASKKSNTFGSGFYDVYCDADVYFKSGIEFTLTTRLLINWPRDRYASIPIVLKLKCEEISGKMRFGVVKNGCMMCFMSEPYTRFSVDSEFGDQFKLKNIPKLSELIIKQVRKTMNNRIVYPNVHLFRLIWPRTWWPVDTQGFFPEPVVQKASTDSKDDSNSGSKDGNVVKTEVFTSPDHRTSESKESTPALTGASTGDDKKKSSIRNTFKNWFNSHSVEKTGTEGDSQAMELKYEKFAKSFEDGAKSETPGSTVTTSVDSVEKSEPAVTGTQAQAPEISGNSSERKPSAADEEEFSPKLTVSDNVTPPVFSSSVSACFPCVSDDTNDENVECLPNILEDEMFVKGLSGGSNTSVDTGPIKEEEVQVASRASDSCPPDVTQAALASDCIKDQPVASATTVRTGWSNRLQERAGSFMSKFKSRGSSVAEGNPAEEKLEGNLRTPLVTSAYSWVVLKNQELLVFKNKEAKKASATYNLVGCLCRPLDPSSGFEICVNPDYSSQWVKFWGDSEEQSKEWMIRIMSSSE